MRSYIYLCCVVFVSCTNQNEFQQNLTLLKNNSDSFVESKTLTNSLADSINLWIDRKVSLHFWLKKRTWKVSDIVCVNSTRNVAVLICIIYDSTGASDSWFSLFYSIKKNDQWNIYAGGMPQIQCYAREKKPSYEDVSRRAFEMMIEGGLIEDGKINDKWINGWNTGSMERTHRGVMSRIEE